jgi:hypothetical protein
MKIANNKDFKIGVFDIETLKECFHFGLYDPDSKKWIEFEVSQFKNDLYKFVKFYTNNDFDYFVSFNGIDFDHPVLETIVREYDKWAELDNKQIAERIWSIAQKVIDDKKYNVNLVKEEFFSVKPMDVFKILHFDNDARRTSLKFCEFMMNMDVEEMPIHHSTENLTYEMIEAIKAYEKKDIIATLGVFYIVLGDLNSLSQLLKDLGLPNDTSALDDYRGKNKIQDRFDVKEETGLDCLNWSDVKIGEEWNKLDYKLAMGIKDDFQLQPKKVIHPYGKRFKEFFPKWMDFKTKKLQEFVESFGNEYVKNIKQEFKITIGKTTYTVAKGGLHSNEKSRSIIPPIGYVYNDIDVGSQYPNSIVKLKIYAPHLNEVILVQYNEKIDRRITYKHNGNLLVKQGDVEKGKKLISVQEMLKLALNGGFYGKLGQNGSFLEYPYGLLKVCICNQIEILMLVEMMESAGFQVLSGNTDGLTVMYPEKEKEKFLSICAEWEKIVGNDKLGKLEHTIFKEVYQESVNSYIAIKDDNKIKKKGRFITTFELNKNKSARVIPLAIEAYIKNKVNVIDFIKNHDNIFDFCIAKKATGQMHYEEIVNEEKTIVHKKLIRYYISNNGSIMMKRGFDYEGKAVNTHCEAPNKNYEWLGQPKVTYFNSYKEGPYDINYSYYIIEALSRIDSLKKTKMCNEYLETLKPKKQGLLW